MTWLNESQEAFELWLDTMGFDYTVKSCNAAWFLNSGIDKHGMSDTLYTLKEGMQQIPQRLCQAIPNQVHLNHKLQKLGYNNGLFELGFDGKSEWVKAKIVVLNLSPMALEKLRQNSPFLQNLKTDLFSYPNRWVEAFPKTKIFVTYDQPWWGKVPGRSVTTLPIGLIHYNGATPEQSNCGPFLMLYSGRWKTFWAEKQFGNSNAPNMRGIGKPLDASEEFKNEVHRQLVEAHGMEISEPKRVVYCQWDEAYYQWRPGVPITPEFWKTMCQPISGLPLFLTGEAYTWEQGTMEGPLLASEEVFKRI